MGNARINQLSQSMIQQRIHAALVSHPANIRYLSGFTGSSSVLLLGKNQNLLFTDGRYRTQAREEVEGARVVVGKKAPAVECAEWLIANSCGSLRLGYESDHLTIGAQERLRKILPARVRLLAFPPVIERARMIKDKRELARIRAAAQLASRLFAGVVDLVRPGVRELDVAAELEYRAKRAGAEGMSFETIIAAGRRSALPHGRATKAKIGKGFVVCDFGVILGGYCSDMTRTVHVGRPTRPASQLYDAVLESQLAALHAVRPGVSVGEVDLAARRSLTAKGLEKFFTHSTGHGVGLEIHESPRVAAGQTEVLQPGMIITIEPGAYIPEKCGVRIEDMVAVTQRGCEILTPTSKELIAI